MPTVLSADREAELRRAFASIDTDGSGSITRTEFIVGLRDVEGLAATLNLSRVQTSATLAELLNLPPEVGDEERRAFERVFHMMDRNDDSGIELEEFLQFFLHGNTTNTNSAAASASAGAAASADSTVEK